MLRSRKKKKEGGLNLHRDRKMDFSSLQPEKCKDCVWGRWDSAQFCSRIKCVKEDDDAKTDKQLANA